MPYTKENAPDAAKALPAEAFNIWLGAYNSAFETYKGDEGKAAATAWSAVEKAGYAKGEDGKWAKTEKHEEKPDAKKTEEFKEYRNVIRAVALLGADIPEVKTLEDATALGENGDAEIEVFEAGYHKGHWYGIADLDQMAANFNELGAKIRPPLKLGHTEEEGRPALGWMKGVRREGRKLLGAFSDMPLKLREAIKQRRYGRVSMELYPSMSFAEGKYESIWLFAEPDTKGGDKKMGKFTEEEVELREQEATEKAEAKYREELARAGFAERAAAKKVDELQAKAREGAVATFTEGLKRSGLAPALADMAAEVFARLDAEKPEKFAEGTIEKPEAEYFSDFVTEFVKRAKAGKGLIVEFDEKAEGGGVQKNSEEKEAEETGKLAKETAAQVQPQKAEKK
jgi:cation transport regulator ChaB